MKSMQQYAADLMRAKNKAVEDACIKMLLHCERHRVALHDDLGDGKVYGVVDGRRVVSVSVGHEVTDEGGLSYRVTTQWLPVWGIVLSSGVSDN